MPLRRTDADAPARGAGRDRLSTVRVDFFLNPAERLTEQERALMTAMLHCLVGDIADEVRAALPSGVVAANDDGNLALVESLTAPGLLNRAVLVRMLLRRADEERIATAAKARSGRREARVLQGLVSHDSGAISAAAMSLILARGRRRDRFGQCLLHFDDLPPARRRRPGADRRRRPAQRPRRDARRWRRDQLLAAASRPIPRPLRSAPTGLRN